MEEQKKRKTYFVNIRANGWIGWNSVYASSKKEAKSLLLKKLGERCYADIIWESLLVGKKAESMDARMEQAYRGMFD